LPSTNLKPWYELRGWRTYASQLFNYYARTRGYRVVLTPAVPTACLYPQGKLCLANPLWKPLNDVRVRTSARYLDLRNVILHGFLSHEAAHARFSPKDVDHDILDLWNKLEDERIERLQAKDYRHNATNLADTYAFYGDGLTPNSRVWTCADAVLLWRFCHDRRDYTFQVSNQKLWEQVRPRVEAAWCAPDATTVVTIAWELKALLEAHGEQPSVPWYTHGKPPDLDEATWQKVIDDSLEVATGDRAEDGDRPASQEPILDVDAEMKESDLAASVEGYARQLSKVLHLPITKHLRPSSSRGALSCERYLDGSERQFLYRPKLQHTIPLLTLVQDLSSSMSGERHEAALQCAALVNRACALAKSPRQLIGFHHEAFFVATRSTPFEEALRALCQLRPSGSTNLSQGLELAVQYQRPQLIVILCDGELTDADVRQCKTLVKRSRNFMLPILLDEVNAESYNEIFGRSHTLTNVDALTPIVISFLGRLLLNG
jgi:hypothetical protein